MILLKFPLYVQSKCTRNFLKVRGTFAMSILNFLLKMLPRNSNALRISPWLRCSGVGILEIIVVTLSNKLSTKPHQPLTHNCNPCCPLEMTLFRPLVLPKTGLFRATPNKQPARQTSNADLALMMIRNYCQCSRKPVMENKTRMMHLSEICVPQMRRVTINAGSGADELLRWRNDWGVPSDARERYRNGSRCNNSRKSARQSHFVPEETQLQRRERILHIFL